MTYIKQLEKSLIYRIEYVIAFIGIITGFLKKEKNDYKLRLIHPIGLLIFVLTTILITIKCKFKKKDLVEEIKSLKKENFVII